MRVVAGKYPEETEIARWLVFDNTEEAKISLVFARRLAALARDNKKKIHISEGRRSLEKQKEFYQRYLDGTGNYAAKPDEKNGSQHQYGFATDIGDPANYWKNKASKEWMNHSKLNQSVLNKYGICIPLNSIDMIDKTKVEWWHWTPIEVYASGFTGNRIDFLQKDDAIVDWEKELLRVADIDFILKELNGVISNPVLCQLNLEGKRTIESEWLRTLLIKIFKVRPK